jgi:membrane protein
MTDPRTGEDPTLGALVHQLTQQVPELVRSEIRLAQAEVAEKGKRAGIGIGMFSVAGLLAFFALATFVATAILGLANAVDAWLAALIVAVVLLLTAAVAGLVGGIALLIRRIGERARRPVEPRK